MVSDSMIHVSCKELAQNVLILVLMEYGLGLAQMSTKKLNALVLILVLMEYGLGRR